MSEQMSEMHRAMKHVAETQEEEDRTPLEAKCRQWMIDDFKGFMKALTGYDQALIQKSRESEDKAVDDPDVEVAMQTAIAWLERRKAEHG